MIIRPSTLQEDSSLFILNKLNFIQQTPEINKQQAVQNPITATGQPEQLLLIKNRKRDPPQAT